MKLLFDTEDVSQKFTQLLEDEGIAVDEIFWGGEAGYPTAEIVISDTPDTSKRPLRVELAELKAQVEELRLKLAAVEVRPATTTFRAEPVSVARIDTATAVAAPAPAPAAPQPKPRGRPPGTTKQARAAAQTPDETEEEARLKAVSTEEQRVLEQMRAAAENVTISPNVQRILKEMEEDDTFYGNPLGSTWQRGPRPRNANEFETLPPGK